MKRRLWQLVGIACLACLAGCATLRHGDSQTVTLTSDPAGAKVTVLSIEADGSAIARSRPGVTPLVVDLTRRDPRMAIRFEKDGCAPAEIRVKRSVSGWTYWNFWFANPLALQGASGSLGAQYTAQLVTTLAGVLTDQATGAAFKLPKIVHATLCAPTEMRQCASGCSDR